MHLPHHQQINPSLWRNRSQTKACWALLFCFFVKSLKCLIRLPRTNFAALLIIDVFTCSWLRGMTEEAHSRQTLLEGSQEQQTCPTLRIYLLEISGTWCRVRIKFHRASRSHFLAQLVACFSKYYQGSRCTLAKQWWAHWTVSTAS